MSKHTPGPWTLQLATDARDHEVWFGPYGNMKKICEVINYRRAPEHHQEGVQEANAQLIAAAPEMLEELKLCKRLIEDYANYDAQYTARITKLIAKAEGREE